MSVLDRLSLQYIFRQTARINRILSALDERDTALKLGRAIPAPGNLSNGRGRRIEAAVLFLDVCGFSARPSETVEDQTQLLTIFSILFPELIAIVEDCGGVVEKNTGDGLMAYFVAKEGVSHVQRAIACALTMMDAAQRLINPRIAERGLQPFDFRIAVEAGHITIAQVGRKMGFTHIVAIGTTANLASKMLGQASAGEILVGHDAAVKLPEQWLRFLEPKAFKDWKLTHKGGTESYPVWIYDGRWTTPRSALLGKL